MYSFVTKNVMSFGVVTIFEISDDKNLETECCVHLGGVSDGLSSSYREYSLMKRLTNFTAQIMLKLDQVMASLMMTMNF